MGELIADNWLFFVIALALGIAVAWWVFNVTRKTQIERDGVVDDGPPRRNQALIDAAPGHSTIDVPPPTPEGLAGMSVAVAAAAEPVHEEADDLTLIKGVGPKLQTLLHSLGVLTYAEIANWSEDDIDRVDALLGVFEGRIRRDDWRTQAKLLAAGDTVGFEERFGKL